MQAMQPNGLRRHGSRKAVDAVGVKSHLATPPIARYSSADSAPSCFPHASPSSRPMAGKQKTVPRDHAKSLILLRKSGAGEGIRTLDPNLGKVVLYP